MIRKSIFWIHLVCGVSAGAVVLMMSATGVVLTYERQMLEWAIQDLYVEPEPSAERLPVETLVAAVEASEPGFEASTFVIRPDAAAPATVIQGRRNAQYVNAYTGETLGTGAPMMRSIFSNMTGWHRYFNATGEDRAPWRAITGASNVAFLFLVLSGMYLWLPKIFSRAMFRVRLWFNPQAVTSKARDFNWHHVFGIWSAIPLAVVVATATVFSYPAVSDLVYRSFGEEPPGRRAAPSRPPAAALQAPAAATAFDAAPMASASQHKPTPPERLSLDDLLDLAASHLDGWRTIALSIPDASADTVRFTIDRGNGGQPQYRHTLELHAQTGAVVASQPFSSLSPGRQARSFIRYLHTGEALGILGQTIAGLVSLTSIIMVWTGLALAYRRLIVPLYPSPRRSS
jgi:uncharacterized iron-regulated membrane protein